MRNIQALTQALVLLVGMFTLPGAFAAQAIEEGFDYTRVSKPLAVETGKQIEVVEFFWYRCPHCSKLEPALAAWAGKLPKDVKLRTVPAVFNPNWLAAAKLHYALDEMGVLGKVHDKVFEAYHKEKLDLDNEAQLMSWVKKQGLDEAGF